MKRLTIGALLGTFVSLVVGRRNRAAAVAREKAGRVAEKAQAARERFGGGSSPPQNLEDLTKDELYQRAQDKDIPGRSEMSKDELVEALRGAPGS